MGFSRNTSIALGFGTGFVSGLMNEIGDGTNPYGFSFQDLTLDTIRALARACKPEPPVGPVRLPSRSSPAARREQDVLPGPGARSRLLERDFHRGPAPGRSLRPPQPESRATSLPAVL